ncbi:YlbF family regulator [Eubacteriales bacterium OttesenSCG-928-A19]|nr:YlbF family regulator [Eubacteriales bacterium OttesenSCG-928-A19]
MSIYDSAHELARVIRESDEAREAVRLREIAEADDTNRALLAEYRRLQVALQVQAMGGTQAEPDDMQRFSQISSLLYMNNDVQAYLLAEMRLQRVMADVFKIISEASGMSMELPGV